VAGGRKIRVVRKLYTGRRDAVSFISSNSLYLRGWLPYVSHALMVNYSSLWLRSMFCILGASPNILNYLTIYLLTCLLTHYMKQSRSLEAKHFSVNQ